jgi:hypothetical protein
MHIISKIIRKGKAKIPQFELEIHISELKMRFHEPNEGIIVKILIPIFAGIQTFTRNLRFFVWKNGKKDEIFCGFVVRILVNGLQKKFECHTERGR